MSRIPLHPENGSHILSHAFAPRATLPKPMRRNRFADSATPGERKSYLEPRIRTTSHAPQTNASKPLSPFALRATEDMSRIPLHPEPRIPHLKSSGLAKPFRTHIPNGNAPRQRLETASRIPLHPENRSLILNHASAPRAMLPKPMRRNRFADSATP